MRKSSWEHCIDLNRGKGSNTVQALYRKHLGLKVFPIAYGGYLAMGYLQKSLILTDNHFINIYYKKNNHNIHDIHANKTRHVNVMNDYDKKKSVRHLCFLVRHFSIISPLTKVSMFATESKTLGLLLVNCTCYYTYLLFISIQKLINKLLFSIYKRFKSM